MQCHGDLDLTFNLAVVTNFCRCRKLVLGRDIG